jgi:hypothetical protein
LHVQVNDLAQRANVIRYLVLLLSHPFRPIVQAAPTMIVMDSLVNAVLFGMGSMERRAG